MTSSTHSRPYGAQGPTLAPQKQQQFHIIKHLSWPVTLEGQLQVIRPYLLDLLVMTQPWNFVKKKSILDLPTGSDLSSGKKLHQVNINKS